MNAELLYTSASQGLKQGSRGFCTVLSTSGLPINLAQRLEALSGYRHLYQPGDSRAEANPVCYSHTRFPVGGKTVSVLSRIAAYGVDYSQRTNKIAHHVVVDMPMPACGPAVVLGDSNVMRSEWDGACKTLANGPTIAPTTIHPSKCTSWERIAGDAGWGGVVANAWLQPAPKPLWIIFNEDQASRLLELIQEATAILPEKQRWQATFSTYFTNLPPDVQCRVRCVIAGSDEARMSIARGTVIDLTKPLPTIPPSPAVTAARNGEPVGGPIKTAASLKEDTTLEDEDRFEEVETSLEEPWQDGTSVHREQADTELALQPPSTTNRPPSVLSPRVLPQSKVTERPDENSHNSKQLLPIIAVGFALLTVIGLIIGIVVVSKNAGEKLEPKPHLADSKTPMPSTLSESKATGELAIEDASTKKNPSTGESNGAKIAEDASKNKHPVRQIIVRDPISKDEIHEIKVPNITCDLKILAEIEVKPKKDVSTLGWKPEIASEFFDIDPSESGNENLFVLRCKPNIAIVEPISKNEEITKLSFHFGNEKGKSEPVNITSRIKCFRYEDIHVAINTQSDSPFNAKDGDYFFEGQVVFPVLESTEGKSFKLEMANWLLKIRNPGETEWKIKEHASDLTCKGIEHYGKEFRWTLNLSRPIDSDVKRFFPLGDIAISFRDIISKKHENVSFSASFDAKCFSMYDANEVQVNNTALGPATLDSGKFVFPENEMKAVKNLKSFEDEIAKWQVSLKTRRKKCLDIYAELERQIKKHNLKSDTAFGKSLNVERHFESTKLSLIDFLADSAKLSELLEKSREFGKLCKPVRTPEEDKQFHPLAKDLSDTRSYPSYARNGRIPMKYEFENEFKIFANACDDDSRQSIFSLREKLITVRKELEQFLEKDLALPTNAIKIGDLKLKTKPANGGANEFTIPYYSNASTSNYKSLVDSITPGELGSSNAGSARASQVGSK